MTFTANNRETPRVEIKLSVTVEVTILFVTVEKTATFSLGWLQLPPPVFLASDFDGPDPGCLAGTTCDQDSAWDPDGDGILYLNTGSRAANRNISTAETNEVYYITDGGFDDLGRCGLGGGRTIGLAVGPGNGGSGFLGGLGGDLPPDQDPRLLGLGLARGPAHGVLSRPRGASRSRP